MQDKTPGKKVKKVVIIGPECTGKSELSEFLANHFKAPWVPEFARTYLDKLIRPYVESDLLEIAHGQIKTEDQMAAKASQLLLCDTNLIVIKVWSHFKYGRCDSEILHLIQTRPYDLYLLTYIDIPWQEDPQREHPHMRQVLWNIYKGELQKQKAPFVEIRGEREQRRKTAIDAINKILTPS